MPEEELINVCPEMSTPEKEVQCIGRRCAKCVPDVSVATASGVTKQDLCADKLAAIKGPQMPPPNLIRNLNLPNNSWR